MSKERKRGTWLAGAGVILLFAVLLLIRLDWRSGAQPGRGGEDLPTQASIPAGDAWLSITQGGRKIGYARRRFAATPEGGRFSEDIVMRINTMGLVQPLRVRTEAHLGPDAKLLNFQFDLQSNLFKFTARGTLAGKNLTVWSGRPGEERASVISLESSPYLGGALLGSMGAEGIRPGEKRTFPIFDPASLGQKSAQVMLIGEETVTIMGQHRKARKLVVDFMGMKQIAWIEPDGSVLREEGIMGIVLERVAREEALAGLEGAVSADLTEIAAIPSRKPIQHAESVKVLKIGLGGFQEGVFLLDGGRQEYRKGVLTVRLEHRAGDPLIRQRSPAEDIGIYLKSNPLIQSDHPKIRQQAEKITFKDDLPDVKAQKLVAWVHKNIEKRPVLSVPDALTTLENRIGDCNEHAVLLAAFARASGIPAEVEAGVVYLRDRFYYHAWNILYLPDWGGWITADAVLGQIPADVTHIRFVRGGSDRQLDIVGLIGKLKIDILEMVR